MIQTAVFYLTAAVLVFSALMVVTQRAVFTCALFLAANLSAVAVLFVMLSADFLAAVQILVYVGGILVIIIFAVMFSNVEEAKSSRQVNEQWVPASLICLAVLAAVLVGVKKSGISFSQGQFSPTTRSIGELLLGDLILPFEVVSLVLLASLVGAVIFSKREPAE